MLLLIVNIHCKWVVVGKAEAHNEDLLKNVHTDSPASGRHWMANKVSFKNVKMTNNKNDKNKRHLVCLHYAVVMYGKEPTWPSINIILILTLNAGAGL